MKNTVVQDYYQLFCLHNVASASGFFLPAEDARRLAIYTDDDLGTIRQKLRTLALRLSRRSVDFPDASKRRMSELELQINQAIRDARDEQSWDRYLHRLALSKRTLQENDKVRHPTLGIGIIKHIEQQPDLEVATIVFEDGTERRIGLIKNLLELISE